MEKCTRLVHFSDEWIRRDTGKKLVDAVVFLREENGVLISRKFVKHLNANFRVEITIYLLYCVFMDPIGCDIESTRHPKSNSIRPSAFRRLSGCLVDSISHPIGSLKTQ